MTSLEDSQRIAPMGSETGTFVSMVMSYWEQACALLNYGLLHEDLFFRNQRRILWSLGEAQAGRPSISGEVRRQDVLLEPEKSGATVREVDRGPFAGSHRCDARVHGNLG